MTYSTMATIPSLTKVPAPLKQHPRLCLYLAAISLKACVLVHHFRLFLITDTSHLPTAISQHLGLLAEPDSHYKADRAGPLLFLLGL